MEEEYNDFKEFNKLITTISQKLEILENAMDDRFEKLKEFLVKYLTMGNEFALGSLKAALKNI